MASQHLWDWLAELVPKLDIVMQPLFIYFTLMSETKRKKKHYCCVHKHERRILKEHQIEFKRCLDTPSSRGNV